ncbi:MAG: TRAP transporter small permease [Tissierellia bacterium]|nr:TRAP transporter small permease [Tissierellia bacterium]
MEKIIVWIRKFVDIFLILSLAAMVIIVVIQVLTRYVFFYSLPWSEESSRYLFAWLIFLGASVGVRDDSQIGIDLIDTVIRTDRSKKVLNLFIYTVQLISCLVLLYNAVSFIRVGGAGQRSPAMHLPMTLVYLCLIIGFLLMLMELILKLKSYFGLSKENNHESGERGVE